MFRAAMPALMAVLSQKTRGQRELSRRDTKVVIGSMHLVYEPRSETSCRLLVGMEMLLHSECRSRDFSLLPSVIAIKNLPRYQRRRPREE